MPLSPGDKLGPYQLLAPIGRGGMGEVWRARDPRLNRDVAIKSSLAGFSGRFKTEAEAIAALNHPHICQIYDVGPDYLVMELIDGQPLSAQLKAGPLALEDAMRVAIQVADALEEAHGRGILHRDLKPANILCSVKGGAKLVDFGLAKMTVSGDEDVTAQTMDGTVLGTAPYMSPEQAQGKTIDQRSDVFSFGTVFYEMLSGRRPFGGNSMVDVLSAVIRDEPPALDSPAWAIVKRCLAKRIGDRYAGMADVKAALEQTTQQTGLKIAPQSAPSQQPSIAVLPFANMSRDADDDYFSDGLVEEIINLLAKIPGLKVIARTSAFAFRGKEQDIRGIAGTLGVSTILEGSVRRAGSRIRVTAQLIAAGDGSHLFSERYDREIADIFALQDELAAAITAALRIRLSGSSVEPRRYTPGVAAYEAYLRARFQVLKANPKSLELGRQYYEQAISLDSGFALPHSGLAFYYYLSSAFVRRPAHEAAPLARAAATEALRIDPSLAEANAILGTMAALYDLDWNKAQLHFDLALATQPAPRQARQEYAVFQCLRGRVGEAIEIAGRLIEEDPLEVWPRMNLQLYLQAAGREAEACDQLHKVIELNDHLAPAHVTMASLLVVRGDVPQALESAHRAYSAAPWYGDSVATLAALLRLTGDESGARALLLELGGDTLFGNARCYALFHVFCGELDAAADYVEKAIEERDWTMMLRLRLVLFRRLYASPRWPKIAELLKLPESAFPGSPVQRQ